MNLIEKPAFKRSYNFKYLRIPSPLYKTEGTNILFEANSGRLELNEEIVIYEWGNLSLSNLLSNKGFITPDFQKGILHNDWKISLWNSKKKIASFFFQLIYLLDASEFFLPRKQDLNEVKESAFVDRGRPVKTKKKCCCSLATLNLEGWEASRLQILSHLLKINSLLRHLWYVLVISHFFMM